MTPKQMVLLFDILDGYCPSNHYPVKQRDYNIDLLIKGRLVIEREGRDQGLGLILTQDAKRRLVAIMELI